MNISHALLKGIPALCVKSGRLQALFLPNHGAKLASLCDLDAGIELLAQHQDQHSPYRTLSYEGTYVDGECSAFDDMFPTIDRYYYADAPWAGTEIPDHGEVCALPFETELTQSSIRMHTHGIRLPYHFIKTISSPAEGSLRIDYRVENPTPFPMDCLWAAHMMLAAEQDAKLFVGYPEGSPVRCVFSWDQSRMQYGDILSWPEYTDRSGVGRRLDVTQVRGEQGTNYKYYFMDSAPGGWAEYRRKQCTLRVSWPDTVPYLGVWVNEGSFKGIANIALEPCISAYDRPDVAKLYGCGYTLDALSALEWHMMLALR